MKKLLCSLTVVLFLITVVSSAEALTIVNGSFETGDFTGWALNGNTDSYATFIDDGFFPTDGERFANLYAMAMMGQEVAWERGDVLSFDWNFNANDQVPFNDFSFFAIYDYSQGGIHYLTLADVASMEDGESATGWNSYSYTFSRAGVGRIAFGVINIGGDDEYDSQLYIDNVVGSNPVPEPATLLLLGAGLLGLISRKKSSKS